MSVHANYSDIYVCADCMFADANGCTEHEGEWFVDGSDTPTDREPFGLIGDAGPRCTNNSEDGDEYSFYMSSCDACGTRLGGARYRFALWDY